ncbi:MAG: hypothetical protein PHQ74_05215 [Crocinitomicaceae bacterium]|nr:hypothetical protein [Crocinitomicaceae bacterium]
MKRIITAFAFLMAMTFSSYSLSQNVVYQSDRYDVCVWNAQTQSNDLCQEVVSNVQIEINRPERELSITTDGNIAVYEIDEEQTVSNPTMEFELTSADGTSWKMMIHMLDNTIRMYSVDDPSVAAIKYFYN